MIKPISFGCVCHNFRKIDHKPKNPNGYQLASDSERIEEQKPDFEQQYDADLQVQLRGYDFAKYLCTLNGRYIYNPVKSDNVITTTAVAMSQDGNSIDWCYNFNPKSIEA